MIIGLTGQFCSGKSSAEKFIAEKYGFSIIDADKSGHEILVEQKDVIVRNFGSNILAGNEIDRKKLGDIVFKDAKKLKLLNSILHPLMIKQIKAKTFDEKSQKILINAALLFEMGLDELCSHVIIIKAPFCKILIRAKKRSGTSIFKTLKILNFQKVLKLAKQKEKKADIFYINNRKDISCLNNEIKFLFDERINCG